MHINSLKIQGFKSYRDETIVDPFSPGLNLLVGRNGSGKSNFFSAIRFVLSDAYTSLSREERQALLHDGSTGGGGGGGSGGGATMSAFVEIEFDNTDGRFPTNKPTLLLRRTIGLKKDEFQLDRKSTSKSEVMNVLESAGFSRSNPYYIVPQGRITHLTNQKDTDRLALLKEVAGTKVYEERRAESTKIMDETQSKRDKINESLEFINARLEELEEEKEELKQFQVQDRTRRTLQYQILQRELKDISEGLDSVEEDRRRDVDNANTRRAEFNTREKEMAELEEKIMAEKQALELVMIEHRQSSADRRDAVKAKAQVECIVQDAEEAGQKGRDKLNQLEKELVGIEATILVKETELMEVTPDWEDRLREETLGKQKLEAAETTLRTLYAKQGRTSQFKNQKDRDTHLKTAIAANNNIISTRQKAVESGKKDLGKAKKDLEDAVENVKTLREENEGRKESLTSLTEELNRLKIEEGEASEKRKNLWKEDSRMQSQVKHASEQLKNAERTMAATMDRDTARGLKSAQAIATRLGIEGYHGPLCELFTVEDRYKVAVEVTAGTSLFQIVVDNDDIATRILDIMVKEQGGRVTFMPLNRLKETRVEFPKAKEAIAMITKLTFDKKYALAFDQVFGKTIICQSLEIAGAYTRSHGLNSITLEGDKYDRKGSLTGGFHDVRHSRLDAVKNLKEWQEKYERAHAAVEEGKAAVSKIDQEITQLVGKAQVAEGKRSRVQDGRESLISKIVEAQNEEERLRQRVTRLEAGLETNESSIRNLGVEVEALQEELKTKMEENLSEIELQKVAELNSESDQTKKDLVDLSKSVSKLATKKNLLEIELNERLRRRREELRGKIESYELAGPQNDQNEDVEARKQELNRLERSIDELTEKLDAAESKAAELTNLLAQLEKEREKKEGQQEEDGRSIQRQQKTVERYLHKRSVMVGRKDAANKNIRDLGVLPEEAFVETTSSTDKLVKKLHKVMHALEDFTHVNKKAYEQYTTFTKQRDDLIARQTELDDSSQSILDLIDHLDRRKDEAIERTFKQVAKYFEEVFEKLVPAGRGRLIMQKRELEQNEDDMEVDGAEPGGVESYTGVAIRVSFNSKSNEGLKIQQLSGGQKALVALAMIFAIQKCDPAPFYLFDEIDANLDADRRTGVAAMIQELSQTGQYICTTFRPELIPHADAFFGVIFDASKISNVKKISSEECMEFVDAADAVRA